jgi:histidyl-tRNA synthetase
LNILYLMIFKRHDFVNIQTHVFELKQTLIEKYGDDTKLIYNIVSGKDDVISWYYNTV